ncbi:Sfi1 spindle body [Ascosphaera apis ARSEF 7405]|uniref:Sfi1 spindle body n=1 Tax=Ascosphaera apis ARSEF 7405 TaxID=392613 RepID=A0A167ZWT5_9EURO|nr:Sfi1 spindle body [Ascosphaera apis ARSEF 7405]
MPSDQIDLESALDEHLSLTDQDVDILHQIITRAEQHPDVHRLPFRAIFSAYDDVLYEHGVDPRQDEVCFRFLFLLGSREIEGRGLYEKFVTLLARMGIQLAYDDDEHVHAEKHDEGDGKVLARRDRRGSEMKKRAIAAAPTAISRKREKPKRRASFNSMYDATEDISQRPTKRPSSRSSVSRLETGSEIPRLWREIDELEPVPALPAAVALAGFSERNQSHSRRPSQSHKRTSSGRDQAVRIARHLPLEELADPEIDAKFEVYTANKKQKQARREVNGDAEHSSSTSSSTSISGDDDHLNDIDENNDDEPPLDRDNSPIPAAHLPRELVYKPTLSSLLRDASTFNMYRERNNLRNYFRTWCAKASRHRELFSHLYATAEARDSMTLKRQAFDLWRSALAEKRHKVQTQKLFENLEQRAGRARDLYLLGHTLSIWRGKAAAETEKTKSARAHILAVKYFTAWEELTAARELQIRKFTLNKPFRLWREKLPLIQQHERTADAIYRRHLIRTIYWRWFWAFCERRAPSYRNSSLKQKHLILWIRALRTNHEREREAIAQDGHVLVQASFQTWKAKREIMAEAEDVAVMRWKHKRLRDCLTEWNVKTRLGHAAYYTTVAINTRIAKSAFDTWLQRSRQQRLARDYQNYRLLKSAWTNWNDKLRVQALGQRIDERILMQVLYKWLLLGRQQLMQRIHDQRLLREAFDKMFVQSKKNFNKLLNREDKFRIHWQQKLMRGKLEKWRDKIQCLKQREIKAMEFYGPRLNYDFLIVWHKRLEWLQGYMKVADEVRRRRLMMDYLTKWRESTKNHIKQHRLNAYAIFRRKHKMALASHALNTWNNKTHAISDMQATADTHHTAQTKFLSENCFRHWFTVTSNRAGDMHNADIHYNRKLVRAYLDRILDLRLIHRDQEEQSTQLLTAHISRVAAAQLRKLSLRLFQIRANWETADRQKERSVRKQIKGVFRIWLGQARDARALRRSTLLGSARGAPSMSRGGGRSRSEGKRVSVKVKGKR